MTNKIREVKDAKGVRGILIRVEDGHVFRIYNKDHTFVDYDILHYDLEIKILEKDSCLYRSEYGDYLDYKPIDEMEKK